MMLLRTVSLNNMVSWVTSPIRAGRLASRRSRIIVPPHSNSSLLNVLEARDELSDGALASARGADKRDCTTARKLELPSY